MRAEDVYNNYLSDMDNSKRWEVRTNEQYLIDYAYPIGLANWINYQHANSVDVKEQLISIHQTLLRSTNIKVKN